MTAVAQAGIQVELLAGWEARFQNNAPGQSLAPSGRSSNGPRNASVTYSVAHVANFALPIQVSDFGAGAVEIMTSADIFVALCEYGPESVGTALFASQGLPTIKATDFGKQSLQRVIEGQGGCQKFFTEKGRPFCLYVVVGSYLQRFRTVPIINQTIQGISIT